MNPVAARRPWFSPSNGLKAHGQWKTCSTLWSYITYCCCNCGHPKTGQTWACTMPYKPSTLWSIHSIRDRFTPCICGIIYIVHEACALCCVISNMAKCTVWSQKIFQKKPGNLRSGQHEMCVTNFQQLRQLFLISPISTISFFVSFIANTTTAPGTSL